MGGEGHVRTSWQHDCGLKTRDRPFVLKLQRKCRFHMMAENGENTSERPMLGREGWIGL